MTRISKEIIRAVTNIHKSLYILGRQPRRYLTSVILKLALLCVSLGINLKAAFARTLDDSQR